MIEVTGPDGVIIRFPEGTPQDVILGVMRERYGGPEQPAQPAVDLRPRDGESREDYRARIEAARDQVRPNAATQEMNAQALAEMTRPTWGQVAYDNLIGDPYNGITSPGERIGTWLNRAGESMTIGTVGDEAAAGFNSLFGLDYATELARYRQNEQENLGPWGRLSADIFGGIVPAVAGVGAVGQASGLLGRMGIGAGLGLGAGATQGFMEGEDGLANRGVNALIGGAAGGILGGAVPLAAQLGRSAVAGIANRVRDRRIGQTLASQLDVNPRTAQVLAEIVGSEDQDALAAALRRAGPNAMLADGSNALSQTLDAAIQSPVPGTVLARERIANRAGDAYYGLMDALDPYAGPRLPPQAAMTSIREGARDALGDAYRAAYSTPIPYGREMSATAIGNTDAATDAAQGLLGLTNRIPAQAINYANQLMRVRGEQSAQIMASIADDGSVTFQRLPDVRQWDYIKQALDFMAEAGDGAGALGGQTRLGSAYQSLARDIRDNLARAVPAYGDAVSTAADTITRRQAVQFGTELLSPRVTTEEALERIGQATEPQLRAMRDGVIGQINEAMGNVRAVGVDQNVDARQALAALRQFSSPNAQTRLAMLFGDQWDTIRTRIDEASAAVGLRARTATGSQTAPRQFANQLIEDVTSPSALERGRPIEALRNTAAGLAGASPEAIQRAQAAVRSQLADALTRPDFAQRAVPAIQGALAANPYNLGAGGNTALGIGILGYMAAPAAINHVRGLLGAN